MDLNLKDIIHLYGPKLYWIETPSQLHKQTSFDEKALIWKTKPNGKITVILAEPEFKDKSLTNLLKNIVQALKIPFEAVNFGVITKAISLANLETMPTEQGIIFGNDFISTNSNPLKYANRTIYVVPKLSQMINNQEMKKIAWNTLKELKLY
ncbi:MAG: hypothetical protein RML72_01025 [Bacteroidia bacterium]|nr:hypothetical protein [Bacteroidia bacterium]MDW8157447.1 hypothetical protein [Bacteroidia bacterium]